jgi:hypothetical protein
LNYHDTGGKMKYLMEGLMAFTFVFVMGWFSYETKEIWMLLAGIFVAAMYLIADWSD